jgi:hypothetical protein
VNPQSYVVLVVFGGDVRLGSFDTLNKEAKINQLELFRWVI